MVRIRNGKVLAHKLSVSEGWYLFAEVCSRNYQFGTRWKWQSRLFGCRKHVVYTLVVEMTNSNPHRIANVNVTSEVRQMLLRGNIFSQISWEIYYFYKMLHLRCLTVLSMLLLEIKISEVLLTFSKYELRYKKSSALSVLKAFYCCH